ncbi:MAG: bifunctional phosphoglucose/phosphomannose isomerase [Candidatus Levybacteria bacterium]|nr:bifunctional phosphoglucose/phosphomannose isomerase [Candidatus Levybacteria bacterium]
MIDLNNPKTFKHLDPKDVFGSTGLLADQVKQVVSDFKSINAPEDYKKIDNIVISGMGGSAYGGHVASSLLKDQLSVPLYVNNNYTLPEFVNEQSLVILISYSGSTEETLASVEDAKNRGAKISGLTSGGKLAESLKEYSSFYYIFDPKNNPSGQPRLGTGYTVFGTLSIINKLGFCSDINEQVNEGIIELENNSENIKKKSISLAKKIQGNIPVIFTADFLEGNSHIIRNQFNETSKSFSSFSPVPELNHHLMEGLKYPNDKKLTILFLDSDLYPPIIRKRIRLTQDVVSKNNIPFETYSPSGSSKLSQVLDVLSLGGYLTFYLGILYNEDPSLIPWVDYFKAELAK